MHNNCGIMGRSGCIAQALFIASHTKTLVKYKYEVDFWGHSIRAVYNRAIYNRTGSSTGYCEGSDLLQAAK